MAPPPMHSTVDRFREQPSMLAKAIVYPERSLGALFTHSVAIVGLKRLSCKPQAVQPSLGLNDSKNLTRWKPCKVYYESVAIVAG
jgi:hypothetical protein